MEPESRFYRARRLNLHYVDWGAERASPLLLIHGGLDHCRSWDWTARALRTNHHVMALDLAGHGDSDHAIGSSYNLTDFVFDIAEFVRQRGFERVAIIGHSMGGAISALFAGAFPDLVDRLVLIEGLRPGTEPMAPAHERIRRWVEQTAELTQRSPRPYPSVEAAERRMRETNPHLSPEQARHLTLHGLKRCDDGFWRWKYDNFIRARPPARLSPEEVAALWRRIACPALLIGGAQSGRPDPAENGWLSEFQKATSVMAADAGHWVHHDRLEEFLGLVRPFLAA